MRSLIPWRDKTSVPAKTDDYFDPFVNFRREVDRMFDDFFSGFGSRSMERWSGSVGLSPVIDVADGEKELVVTAELPGLDEKDFEVTLAGDVLTIKGEKKVENESRNGNAHYVERRFGSFSRSVRLPFAASDSEVDATYQRGVLTIRLPKPEDLRTAARRIEVKASP